jgi:glutathione S-transferase
VQRVIDEFVRPRHHGALNMPIIESDEAERRDPRAPSTRTTPHSQATRAHPGTSRRDLESLRRAGSTVGEGPAAEAVVGVVYPNHQGGVMSVSPVRVFCFSPAWGLPTVGPFALKLIGWLKMAGIEHVLVHEDNPNKGPKGKSPWIEDGSVRMGDTSLIIDYLGRKHGADPDKGAPAVERAQDLVLRRMLEEHTHQIVEYELFVDDRGFRHIRAFYEQVMPPVVRRIVPFVLRTLVRRQLHARGVARHSPDDITQMGIADVDAVVGLLGDRPFLGGDAPRTVDASAFGMLGMLAFAPFTTPVASHIRAEPKLMGYLERLRARWHMAGPGGNT